MSIKALNWAFEHEETFHSSQRFVLVALANFSSETGKAYPQVSTICRLTGLQDDTVRTALKALVDQKIIVDTGQRAGPTQQVKVYQLPPGACEVKTPENRGLQKDPRKQGASTPARPGEDPCEDPEKTPENRGQSLTDNHNPERNGAGALPSEPEAKPQKLPPEAEYWNANCGRLPKVAAWSASRQRHLAARLKDPFWVANFKGAVLLVSKSPFCCGQNDRGWRADFTWLVERPDAVAKVVEGKYSSAPAPAAKAQPRFVRADRNL